MRDIYYLHRTMRLLLLLSAFLTALVGLGGNASAARPVCAVSVATSKVTVVRCKRVRPILQLVSPDKWDDSDFDWLAPFEGAAFGLDYQAVRLRL